MLFEKVHHQNDFFLQFLYKVFITTLKGLIFAELIFAELIFAEFIIRGINFREFAIFEKFEESIFANFEI